MSAAANRRAASAVATPSAVKAVNASQVVVGSGKGASAEAPPQPPPPVNKQKAVVEAADFTSWLQLTRALILALVLSAKRWITHIARGVYYYSLMLVAASYLVAVQLQRGFIRLITHYQRRIRSLLGRIISSRSAAPTAVGGGNGTGAAAGGSGKSGSDSPTAESPSAASSSGSGGASVRVKWRLPASERHELLTRDGLHILYYMIKPNSLAVAGSDDSQQQQQQPQQSSSNHQSQSQSRRRRLMVFANGLGVNSNFTAYTPILQKYQAGHNDTEWTFLTWSYRGLFDSEQPKRARRLAIPNHAEDLNEILTAQNWTEPIDVLIGHSMGVQVSLEFAALYPERVQRLVLLNGTHGHVFNTAFQPLFRIPLAEPLLHSFVVAIQSQPHILAAASLLVRRFQRWPSRVYSFFFGSPLMRSLLGADYLADFMESYLGDMCQTSAQHTLNYLRLFQELNAHSVYHLLPQIEQPTLVVSGLLDVLTPAYQSFEIARQMPHATHVVCPTASHVALLESPERVLTEIVKHLEETSSVDGDGSGGRRARYRRVDSVHFARAPPTPLGSSAVPVLDAKQQSSPKLAAAAAAAGAAPPLVVVASSAVAPVPTLPIALPVVRLAAAASSSSLVSSSRRASSGGVGGGHGSSHSMLSASGSNSSLSSNELNDMSGDEKAFLQQQTTAAAAAAAAAADTTTANDDDDDDVAAAAAADSILLRKPPAPPSSVTINRTAHAASPPPPPQRQLD